MLSYVLMLSYVMLLSYELTLSGDLLDQLVGCSGEELWTLEFQFRLEMIGFGDQAKERPVTVNSFFDRFECDHLRDGGSCDWLNVVFLWLGVMFLGLRMVLLRLDHFFYFDDFDHLVLRLGRLFVVYSCEVH